MPLVVGAIVVAIGLVQLAQPATTSASSAVGGRSRTIGRTFVRRKWSGHDVPSAASRGCSERARKSSTSLAVGVVADLRPVGRGQAADQRQQRGGAPRGARPSGSGSKPGDHRPERLGAPVLDDVALGRPDDLERARLARLRGVAPGRDPVAAEDGPDRLGMPALDARPCRGRAGTRDGASPPTPRDRRSSARSGPARRRPSRGRCPNRGGGGRRAGRPRARASRCRSTARRRRARAGSSRTRRPSRPRARRPGRRRPASAGGRAGGRRARPRSACRGRRRSP